MSSADCLPRRPAGLTLEMGAGAELARFEAPDAPEVMPLNSSKEAPRKAWTMESAKSVASAWIEFRRVLMGRPRYNVNVPRRRGIPSNAVEEREGGRVGLRHGNCIGARRSSTMRLRSFVLLRCSLLAGCVAAGEETQATIALERSDTTSRSVVQARRPAGSMG